MPPRGPRPGALLLLAGFLATAAAAPARAEPGDELHAYVLTFGPGDHPFFKFGHNAIWIRGDTGRGLVFNFGTFAFDSPALIPKFLKGRLSYWLSVGPDDESFMSYQVANRSIEAQELDLVPAQKVELLRRLRENARPENREYLYDYFFDNCSTRVRDVVDAIVRGRVRVAGQAPGAQTLRAHALRMTADFLPEYLGLLLGLGSLTDQPIARWDEAFLPVELQKLLRAVRIPGDGGDKPLVKSERVVFSADRPPKPERPPGWTPVFALVGVAAGGGLALLGRRGARGSRRSAEVALGAATSLLGLVFGLLGSILVLLWVATNHKAAHANENVLQCAPFALVLVVSGLQVARSRAGSARRAFGPAAAAALLSALGLVCKIVPGFRQDNWAIIALMLPLWSGLAAGLRALRRNRSD